VQAVIVDFETAGIEPRPDYPPTPVGVAIKWPGEPGQYYAWGHPTGNNCHPRQGLHALHEVWCSRYPVSFHNAQFDLAVATEKLGLPMLPPERIHDTMVLGFLHNPHATSLALKDLAEALLGVPPTERDEVRDWIIANVPEAKRAKKQWGKWISQAPGDLVGKYAIGDVDRTELLLHALHDAVLVDGNMAEAYAVEMALIPVLLRNSREGVRTDLLRLSRDVTQYNDAMQQIDAYLTTQLGAINFDSDAELVQAILAAGLGDEATWPRTEKGQLSATKDVLSTYLAEPALAGLLGYRASLSTCLKTFMEPWLAVAERTGGTIHTQWNSTKQEHKGGTRTGRLSSTPNFQNIPNEFDDFKLPIELPPLPLVRSYIVADDLDQVLLGRDFSSQEVRVFAHFEDGVLMHRYQADPSADMHQVVAELMSSKAGRVVTRKQAKTLNFLNLYGGGAAKLAMQLGVELSVAQELRQLYGAAVPGLRALNREMQRRASANQAVHTLGGRRYYCEPAKIVNGQLRELSYKLVNVIVQGSSADMTKRALLRYDANKVHGRLLLNVHDEVIISCPREHWRSEMAILKDAMENALPMDVPMLSDGEVGYSWTTMQPEKEAT
jgi:DNA polymerase-1